MTNQIKQLNQRIESGYNRLYKKDEAGACIEWKEAWQEFLKLMDAEGIQSIQDFDQRYAPPEIIYNWVQDYEQALGNAEMDDNSFHQERIEYIQEFLRRFEKNSAELIIQNMRQAMAESTFISGEREQGEELFRQWLGEQTDWAWGWISWADCWSLFAEKSIDNYKRAESLLLEGLEKVRDEDKQYFYERLAGLYTKMDLPEQVAEIEKNWEAWSRVKRKTKPALMTLPTHTQKKAPILVGNKIGRNDPCPCGSGKKYKKCCGKDL